jgi:hypothetical protein
VEADGAVPGDYSFPERARDLAGAVRWNIQPPVTRFIARHRPGSGRSPIHRRDAEFG